jgi:N-methylhydantoinase B
MRMDPITIEIMKNAYLAVPEEMGAALKRTAYSPNIKERMDASCALFDEHGNLFAQAEHIPVHLGSMPSAVEHVMETMGHELEDGDQIIMNNPYLGGSHLNDITLVKPVFRRGKCTGFAVNKAHHSDVGGSAPGSMGGTTTSLFEEGIIIPPVRLLSKGREARDVFLLLEKNTRTPVERRGDIRAQIAANNLGSRRFLELVEKYGPAKHAGFVREILAYSERSMRAGISKIPDGEYSAVDFMDSDGIEKRPVKLEVTITMKASDATIDFEGTDPQCRGNINTPFSVALSSVYFALKYLCAPDAPPNQGCYRPLEVRIRKGCLLNPEPPAAVSAGNVETSQRIVDLIFYAMHGSLENITGAQSQGTMNNTLIGGCDNRGRAFTYYETVGGGEGAKPHRDGQDGIHTNMTNTANTPVEALEMAYPLRVETYSLIPSSCGLGKYRGGLGIRRQVRVLTDGAILSFQTDRRLIRPRGLKGGEGGRTGRNLLIRNGITKEMPGKGTFRLLKNDVVVVESPGGGGFGKPALRSKASKKMDKEFEKVR